jgi:phage terminase large subunit-like protein
VNIVAPTDDGTGFPTLGPQVVDWMHRNLVFGPGDLLGQPLVLDAEQQWFIWRFYELYPRGHAQEGRRRFQRCALSLAKGLRKTELAACIAAAELHPDAPVRFNGWIGRSGKLAPGRGVTDPFVVMVAYTEEQSNDLAYAALCEILKHGPLAEDFDIGLERIERKKGGRGKAVSVATSPSATDGARTTFQLFDETHHMTLPRQRQAQQTMLANMPKRPLADPWTLETTTAPEPGAGSIAESTMDYAKAVVAGKVKDSALFYFHRQASDEHDLTTRDGRKAAVIEASGPAAAWRDIDRAVAQWDAPDADPQFLERVWTNRLVQSSSQAFDVPLWKSLTRAVSPVRVGDAITLGFDGSQFHDSTGLVATHIETGYQWTVKAWECPPGAKNWRVPADEVDAAVRACFEQYYVVAFYCDPPYWESKIAEWIGEFGKDTVHEWWTNRPRQMAVALAGYRTAMHDGSLCHAEDAALTRHIGNSRRKNLLLLDDKGQPLWNIQKERSDSPHKIDLAMAAVLSWEARTDAIAQGALMAGRSAYEQERQVWF